MICPKCGSAHIKKNGSVHNKKRKYQCNIRGRRFVEEPQNKIITDETKSLIDRLLLEKLPLAGVARAAKVSEPRPQNRVCRKCAAAPRAVAVTDKPEGRLAIERGGLWPFAGGKDCKARGRLAVDRDARERIGLFTGGRDRAGGLRDSPPPVYRQSAAARADFRASCNEIFPENRRRTVGKETGKTNRVERLNCAFRRRISRLAGETPSFSKKLENHIGAIRFFIHRYNENIRAGFAMRRYAFRTT